MNKDLNSEDYYFLLCFFIFIGLYIFSFFDNPNKNSVKEKYDVKISDKANKSAKNDFIFITIDGVIFCYRLRA